MTRLAGSRSPRTSQNEPPSNASHAQSLALSAPHVGWSHEVPLSQCAPPPQIIHVWSPRFARCTVTHSAVDTFLPSWRYVSPVTPRSIAHAPCPARLRDISVDCGRRAKADGSNTDAQRFGVLNPLSLRRSTQLMRASNAWSYSNMCEISGHGATRGRRTLRTGHIPRRSSCVGCPDRSRASRTAAARWAGRVGSSPSDTPAGAATSRS